MRRSPIHLLLLALMILVLISSSVTAAAEGLGEEAQTFQTLSGFPKTEPKTIEFSSPTVADLNRDGQKEILVADSGPCIWGWDAKGNLLPNFPLKPWGGCDVGLRISGPIAVGDVNGDGKLEIVIGTEGPGKTAGQLGRVFVYDHKGKLLSGWPKEMEWFSGEAAGQAEVYSVGLANITGDSRLEIMAGTSHNASLGINEYDKPVPNFYVWRADGSLVSGFPTGYQRAGIFGHFASANLIGDEHAEIIVARDHRWLHAYDGQGNYLPNWPVETYVEPKIDRQEPFIEYTRNGPVIGDVDGDGKLDIVLTGKVKDPGQSGRPVINSAVLVLNIDGSRKQGWEVAKLGDRAPLTDSFAPSEAPALADLDQDGKLEIIAGLADGTMRAYRANGDLMWKYNFAQGRKLYSSEPVVGDVNGDGKLDVVYGLYSPDGSASSAVGLYALDRNGKPLSGFPLELSHETNDAKSGIRAAPTLTDINGDCRLDILVGSWSGTLYAWEFDSQYSASTMPWPVSRHDNTRSGNYLNQNRVTANANEEMSEGQAADSVLITDVRSQVFLPSVSSASQSFEDTFCQ